VSAEATDFAAQYQGYNEPFTSATL